MKFLLAEKLIFIAVVNKKKEFFFFFSIKKKKKLQCLIDYNCNILTFNWTLKIKITIIFNFHLFYIIFKIINLINKSFFVKCSF